MRVLFFYNIHFKLKHFFSIALDPTKLKARQFARSAAPAKKVDNSLWTETPAERQQRIADEVSGKKRRAANAPDEEPDPDAIKRRRRDEEIRREVEAHTVSVLLTTPCFECILYEPLIQFF